MSVGPPVATRRRGVVRLCLVKLWREKEHAMEPVVDLLRDHMYVVVVALIMLAVVANALLRAATTILTTQARERSRREIAAYVAEGSLSPEQGERLVKADVNASRSRGC